MNKDRSSGQIQVWTYVSLERYRCFVIKKLWFPPLASLSIVDPVVPVLLPSSAADLHNFWTLALATSVRKGSGRREMSCSGPQSSSQV